MRTPTIPPSRPRRGSRHLPDGAGGTIVGGPMRPIDLTALFARGVSMGGAIAGAAQVVTGPDDRDDAGIALSDGSRIIFATMDNVRVLLKA